MRENALVPSPTVLAAMARVHLEAKNVTAAKLLLRRAFSDPSCHEVDALVEYLNVAGDLVRWRDAVAAFDLPPRTVHELKQALFAYFENHGRLHDALTLISEEPGLISPVGAVRAEGATPLPINCERLRMFARRTGGFDEAAEV